MSLGTSPASPIEVLIVDDHPVVRDGLRAAIGAQSDMRLVGEARDGIEAEEEAARLNPHVLLMDINMPRRSGIDAMLNIKRKQPAVKVLLLTVSELGDDLVQ